LTAAAGASVLEAGGNAVDACVAAAFVSWVAESPLTGPGGGSFMLVHDARDARSRLFDSFVAVTGAGERRKPQPMEAVDVVFEGGSETQVFHVGEPSVAVPGALAGLEAAHRSFGSLPWRELAGPAVAHARDGVAITEAQAYLHAILDAILRRSDDARTVYGRDAKLLQGDLLVNRELAATIERIAEHGAQELYAGETGRAVVDYVRKGGGVLTREDLAAYRVIRRRPVTTAYRGHEFRSNPPPSSGGVLIAYGLQQLESDRSRTGTADALDAVARAMRAQAAVRAKGFISQLHRGGLAKRLLSGTTHISVVDAQGNAASLSASLGSGSGVVVPGTGIHLNNMLGELDLVGATTPGARLTSMMAPSVVLRADRTRLVVGSAGSARLRGAILQAIVNVVGQGMDVREAIEAPRVHLEEALLHCEGGHAAAELDALECRGWELVRWPQRNLYFGGVSAVVVQGDGSLAAAGDPRRGGAGVVVG
jgi:gamma-glutamyltranspeptidase/glutathione hydrolase